MCSRLQTTHIFCTGLHFGRSRSFRVIPGRSFWYQLKARIRLPISRSSWLLSCLAPFSRYGDLLAENCLFVVYFCYPSLIRCHRSLCSLWNFSVKLTMRKLDSWSYPPVKTAWSYSFNRFGMIPDCDRQTVGRSDGQTEPIIANTALCWRAVKIILCGNCFGVMGPKFDKV